MSRQATRCDAPPLPVNHRDVSGSEDLFMISCSSCRNDAPAGARWCPICHANLVQSGVGKLASPGKRFAAYVFDLAIPLVAIFFIIPLVAGGTAVAAFEAGLDDDAASGVALVGMVGLVVGYLLWALVLFARGTTPGKRLLRMYVFKESGERAGFFTMFFREWIGKWISAAVFFLGFLWILLDKDRQGWHDKLASTYVAIPPPRGSRSSPRPGTSATTRSAPRAGGEAGSTGTGLPDGRRQAAVGPDSAGRISAKGEAAKWAAERSGSNRDGTPDEGSSADIEASSTGSELASCDSCGTRFREGARFCGQCGTARAGVSTPSSDAQPTDA